MVKKRVKSRKPTRKAKPTPSRDVELARRPIQARSQAAPETHSAANQGAGGRRNTSHRDASGGVHRRHDRASEECARDA